jgi:Leucine-rich repeat (LRR) protein
MNPQPSKQETKSKIDFQGLVKAHGYVNARQLLKRQMVESHQAEVELKEQEVDDSYEPLRVKESTKLSKTAGGVGNRTLIDKILETNRGIKSLENILLKEATGIVGSGGGVSTVSASELTKLIRRNEERNVKKDAFLSNDKIQYSLSSANMELLLPNQDLEQYPVELSETLFLQTSYLRHVKCVRNKFRSLVSHNLPQLSLRHFRYVKSIDLSLNRLVRLPDNFGDLKELESLNLSRNLISSLPLSFNKLSHLHTLDLSGNSFSSLPESFGFIDSLKVLNLSENLFTLFSYAIVRLNNIKKLTFVKNSVTSLAILPPLLEEEDMWKETIDRRTGKTVFMNVLTKEKEASIEHYNGEGIKKKKDLHIFQSEDANNIMKYRQRKIYLSICQIHEWEPVGDVFTGRTFYRNNVSGETSWDLPASLNTIGNMTSIEELVLKNNAIKSLPSSFVKLENLVKLNLSRNRLEELPESIGEMKAIQYLELSNNELKLLPVSLCDCKGLLELLLEDNHLLRLPKDIGFLPQLQKLNVSYNRLKSIPFSLGYCKTLQSLLVAENPMEDPPITEFEKANALDIQQQGNEKGGKGIESILWYLRNRFMIEKHEKPPLIEFHKISINQEITILEEELQETIATRIASSKREGFLNLQLLGLKEIPGTILTKAASHIKKIKLDFNPELNLMPVGNFVGFPKELKKLSSLSIRGCHLTLLPENIYIFERITFLNLEENLLESLPETFCELISLTNLSKLMTFRFSSFSRYLFFLISIFPFFCYSLLSLLMISDRTSPLLFCFVRFIKEPSLSFAFNDAIIRTAPNAQFRRKLSGNHSS